MKLLTIIWFEIRILIKQRAVLFNLFLLPLLLIFILGNALEPLYSTNKDVVIEHVNVMLVEQDDEAHPQLDAFLNSIELEKTLTIHEGANSEDAISALKEGQVDFAVMIPPDFEGKVQRGEGADWELIYGKSHSKNHIAQMIFNNYLDEVNRIQASFIVLGPQASVEVLGTVEAEAMESASVSATATYVDNVSLNEQGKSYSAFQYYAAAMLIMFLLYSGLMVNESLNQEIETRTLYRLQSMPIQSFHIFAGKMAGNSLIAILQTVVIIVGTSWLFHVDWGTNPIFLIILCALIVVASMMLAVIITLWSKSQTVAKTILQLIIIFMTFLSGGFGPFPVDIIQKLSHFTVNHWALQGILRIMLGADQGEIVHHILMLGIISVILLLIGVMSYRKVGYHE